MKQEILCTWFGLPKTAWPPDPWTLLGLKRDEGDLVAIEQRVQERMTKLRTFQLSYPEEATEGMNRLAEAFITLAEASSKKPAAETTAVAMLPKPAPLSQDETSVTKTTKLDWRAEPPPVRKEPASVPEVIVTPEEADDGRVLTAQPFVAPAKPIRREIDWALVRDLAEESDEATSNLATLEAVIERVEMTRRLLHAWDKLGKPLKSPAKKNSAKEAEQFATRLEEIAQVIRDYPAFLGQPGKPGYRVMVLAQFRIALPTVRAKPDDQRADLLFDWQVGRQVLLTHRKYLHKMFKCLRHRSEIGLFLHAVRAFLNDYPRLTLVGILVLVALIGLIVMLLNR